MTLAAAPLFAAHLAAGCTLAEAFLLSHDDYLRETSSWSSALIWDRIVLLASPPALFAAALSALPIWQGVDPLVVLALSDEERRKREDELKRAREAEDRGSDKIGNLLDAS